MTEPREYVHHRRNYDHLCELPVRDFRRTPGPRPRQPPAGSPVDHLRTQLFFSIADYPNDTTWIRGDLVIRARLLNNSTNQSEAFRDYTAIIATARADAAKVVHAARKRARKRLTNARKKGYREGVSRGCREAGTLVTSALSGIRESYEQGLQQAHHDLAQQTHNALSALIPTFLRQHPEALSTWLSEAVSMLKSSRSLTLRYPPCYEETFSHMPPHALHGLTLQRDDSLRGKDFIVEGEHGGVVCSWESLLNLLEQGGKDVGHT